LVKTHPSKEPVTVNGIMLGTWATPAVARERRVTACEKRDMFEMVAEDETG
jgi:hypothetical protein